MPNVNVPIYLTIAFVAFIIGLSKGGLGGTIVTAVTPLLALVLPPQDAKEAVGMGLPLLILGDIFAVWMFWKKWDGAMIRRLMPGLVAGVVIGSILLPILPANVVRLGIALLVLIFVLYKIAEPFVKRNLEKRQADGANSSRDWWQGAFFAGGTGVASTVANAGGPIISTYFLMEHLSPVSFIGTSALFFAIVNVMKIPGQINAGLLRWDNFTRVVWAAPLVPLGVWSGKIMLHYVSQKTFDRLVLAFLFLVAIFLLRTT